MDLLCLGVTGPTVSGTLVEYINPLFGSALMNTYKFELMLYVYK